jgi:hypothetical protein
MKHPYVEFEKTKLWNAVSAAIVDLQKNQDLKLAATQQHVVGYICQKLVKKKVVTSRTVVKKLPVSQ